MYKKFDIYQEWKDYTTENGRKFMMFDYTNLRIDYMVFEPKELPKRES